MTWRHDNHDVAIITVCSNHATYTHAASNKLKNGILNGACHGARVGNTIRGNMAAIFTRIKSSAYKDVQDVPNKWFPAWRSPYCAAENAPRSETQMATRWMKNKRIYIRMHTGQLRIGVEWSCLILVVTDTGEDRFNSEAIEFRWSVDRISIVFT